MIKAVVDTLDELEEHMRAFYKEVIVKLPDGKDKKVIALDLDGADNHPAVAAMKNAFTRQKSDTAVAKAKVAELETKLADLPEGFTAAEWDRLQAEDTARKANPDNKDVNTQLAAQAAALKAQHDTAIGALKTKYDKQVGDLNTSLTSERTLRRSGIVETELASALSAAGVTKVAFMRAAKGMLKDELEVVEEDGKIVVRAKASQGGEDVASFVKAWVQTEDGKLFVEPAKGGGAEGSDNKGGNNSTVNPWSKGSWNLTAQGAIIKADGPKADRMAKQAGHRAAAGARQTDAK